MHQYLVDHAMKNVWMNPRMDNQLVFAPSRVTPAGGALNQHVFMDGLLPLPVQKRRVHIFQVGQLDPQVLGLLRQVPNWTTQRWFSFSEAMNAANLEVTIYNAEGVNLPRTDCYYMYTNERAVIFAVPSNNAFKVDPGKEQIYFRFYRNAYYDRDHEDLRQLTCGYFIPTTQQMLLDKEIEVNAKKNLPGHLRVYVNGILMDRVQFADIKLHDYVEWVHDASVKRVVEWRLDQLFQFRSTLDNVYKYLLHYQGGNLKEVDYQDDIDIHVGFRGHGAYSRGLYYNRNQEIHHRQLTHQDYSICSNVVGKLAFDLSQRLGIPTPPPNQIYVQAMIRTGGYDRGLVFEHQRVFELYKLPEDTIRKALNGVDAVVPEWHAPNLEASAYPKLMKAFQNQLDIQTVQDAYGYNACSVILANTPSKTVTESGFQTVHLPYGLQRNSTVYEFDYNGLLLGHHVHVNDATYEATDSTCRLIEAVVGVADKTSDVVYGQTNIPVPRACTSYRVYLCYLHMGQPTNDWEDITDSDKYEVVNGFIQWLNGGDDHWLMVRSDAKIVAYDLDATVDNGLLNFTLMENPTGDPLDEMAPMKVPMAQLDIWMNRKYLIEGLDYFVKFPQVYVVNCVHLEQPYEGVPQKFHIRMMGLPDTDMKADAVEEQGWVLNGTLSGNNKYDVRDDRVMQIMAGGRLFHKSDVLIAEDRPGGRVLHPHNGLPYQIKDIIVPMRGFTQTETYRLRKKSQEVDDRVSDYMTLKFGEMESNDLSAIPQRYPVVSPFLSHLLYLIRTNRIAIPLERYLSDQEVLALCQPYEKLLAFDPLSEERVDDRFSYVVPHAGLDPYALSVNAYRFFNQIVRLYTQDKVITSGHLTVAT